MNRDATLTVCTRFLTLFLGLIVSILTARWLGPAGRGEFGVVVTLANTIVQFGNLGLASTMTYQLAGDPSRFSALLRNAIWVSIVACGTLAAIVCVVVSQLNLLPGIEWSWILLGVAVAPALLFNTLGSNLLIGLGQIAAFNMFQIGSALLMFCAIMLAGYSESGVTGCLWATFVASIISAIVLASGLWRQGGHGWKCDWRVLRSGMAFSSRVYIVCLLGYIMLRANLLMLEQFCDAEQIGFYAVALQGFETLMILPASVALPLFPRLVKAGVDRWRLTWQSLLRTSLVVCAICIFAAITIQPAIRLLFGVAYLPAAPVFLAMLPAVVFLTVNTFLSQYLASLGIPRAVIGVWTVGVLTVVGGNWLLIPAYSAIGAALSLSIASGTVLCLMGAITAHSRSREVARVVIYQTRPTSLAA